MAWRAQGQPDEAASERARTPFSELLLERQGALCERWLDAILAEYGQLTATRWRKEKDPFANPVGHALVVGLPHLVGAVAREGAVGEEAAGALEAIIRIRSVQDLSPSRAVGFLCQLRRVIEAELAEELAGGRHRDALATVEARIERLTMLAFDTYVEIREQMFRLRQEELKRSVASILRQWHGGDVPAPGAEALAQLSPPRDPSARR